MFGLENPLNNATNESVNEIFEHRKKFISEVGEQLQEQTKAEIELGGDKLEIDYRIISIKEKERSGADSVILLPGFGSGWEGISELGFSLACEGRKVLMPSLPGYGNSSNPSEEYYKTESFDNEAEAINKFLEALGTGDEKFHLVGHSMGSEIFASFAQMYPEKVSSLVLLNPAGVEEKENALLLGSGFILSGMHASIEFAVRSAFSREDDYEKDLKKYIPKTKSPFEKNRLAQRSAEARKLSKGHLLEKLKKINVPVTYISGELDSVFPPGNGEDENSQLTKIVKSANNSSHIEKSVMAGLRHNTTIAPDEITAANIENYLEKAERR
jgi:pimeloyl-ACP methyl ester carboxylesterase